jgi:hypothetical protein
VYNNYGLVGARFVSALFCVSMVFFVYRTSEIIAKNFGQAETRRYLPLLAAMLFSMSVPCLFVSQFANYYSMAFTLYAFGFFLLAKALDQSSRWLCIVAAVILIVSFATRYLLLGYLPIAVLYAAVSGYFDKSKRKNAILFVIVLISVFAVYFGFGHNHIMASINHGSQSGARIADPLGGDRLVILREALRIIFPIALIALVTLTSGVWNIVTKKEKGWVKHLAFSTFLLFAGSLIILYHVKSAHNLTMLSNLVLASFFLSIFAGLGLNYGINFVLGTNPSSKRTIGKYLYLLILIAALAPSYNRVKGYRQWVNWNPVIEAVKAADLPEGELIWSTAREANLGNVWQLRQVFGSRVNYASPWLASHPIKVLELARKEKIPIVIGPLPGFILKEGQIIYGYTIVRKIDLSNGPTCYILKLIGLE